MKAKANHTLNPPTARRAHKGAAGSPCLTTDAGLHALRLKWEEIERTPSSGDDETDRAIDAQLKLERAICKTKPVSFRDAAAIARVLLDFVETSSTVIDDLDIKAARRLLKFLDAHAGRVPA